MFSALNISAPRFERTVALTSHAPAQTGWRLDENMSTIEGAYAPTAGAAT